VLSRLTQKTTYTIFSSANPLSGTSTRSVWITILCPRSGPDLCGRQCAAHTAAGLLSPALPANAPANQVKVAGAIDNALLAGNNPTNAFNAIFNASGNALLNGLTQASGETATGSQQTTFNAMTQFFGSCSILHRRPRRARRRRRVFPPMPRKIARLCFPSQANRRRARRLRHVHQGATGTKLRSALERVGSRFRRFAIDRRQHGAGIQQYHQPHLRHGGGRRLHLLAAHHRRLCAGRRRDEFQRRQWRHGPLRPFQAGAFVATPSGAPISPARWPMAGRTSRPTARDDCRCRFIAGALQRQRFSGRVEGGYRFVTTWIAASASALQPPRIHDVRYSRLCRTGVVGANTFALAYG